MVWIPPRKRSSKSHSTMMSKYKDLEQSDYFRLQQRKSAPKKNKPGAWFRIATLGQYPFYEVAYGETEDAIRSNEWNYIKTKVEGEKHAELLKMTAPQRMDWIVKHFSTLGGSPVKSGDWGQDTDSDTDGTEGSGRRAGSYSSPPVAAISTNPAKPATKTPGESAGHSRTESFHASEKATGSGGGHGTNGNGGATTSYGSSNNHSTNNNHNSSNNNSNTSSGTSGSYHSGGSHSSSSGQSSGSGSSSSGGSMSSASSARESSHASKKAAKVDGSRSASKHIKKDSSSMLPVYLGLAGVVLNMVLIDFWFLRLLLSLFVLLFVLSSYFTWANHALFKINLDLYGLFSMIASRDKKFKRTVTVPDMRDEQAKVLGEKRLIFIRHGESEWNSVFNKGLKVLLPRLFDALVKEAFLMTTLDSVFFDSPLNKEGLQQASQMSNWLIKEKKPSKPAVIEAVNFLNATSQDDSVIVSSPLRRAISTTVIGLRRRLKEKGEKVKILSCLAEISSNVDTISLADEPGSLPDMNSLAGFCSTLQPKYNVTNECFDATENKGRKPIFGSGQDRLSEFCGWVFKRKEAAVIVGGHSLYFRYFFRSFLPTQTSHPLKENKIPNTGVVMFTLQKIRTRDNQNAFRIDPATIVEVYGFGHD